ncbi:MAG: hypothetical protein ACYTFO_05915, partial [Planctomycetota bacterium]
MHATRIGLGMTAALVLSAGAALATEAEAEAVQTTCPVMKGNAIDPMIFTEHDGQRVFFCCQECKASFEAEPAKYLANLPQ